MDNILYTVRKQGAVRVANKEAANTLVQAAKQAGYTFQVKKEGWYWLVIDIDK